MSNDSAVSTRRESLRRGRGAPERPADVSGRLDVLKRAFREFQEDKMTDWAASLTYYGVLAMFPALIAFVGIVGFFADPRTVTDTVTEIVSSIGPASAADTFADPISSIASSNSTSGIMALVGIGAALWSASGYVGAFVRASNMIYGTPEGRPFWKLRPLQILVTLVILALALVVVLALILTGPVVEAVAGPLGLGGPAVTAWQYGKWPFLIVIVMTMIATLYFAAPNVKQPVIAGSLRAAFSPSQCGCWHRPGSPSTWRTLAPTARPTARLGASWSSWCGSGSRTTRSSWALR